jgi:hypothetical protein
VIEIAHLIVFAPGNPWEPEDKQQVPPLRYPGFPATLNSPTPACAAFSKESRMKFANATNVGRKSGVAQWRDLLFILWFPRSLSKPIPFRTMAGDPILTMLEAL